MLRKHHFKYSETWQAVSTSIEGNQAAVHCKSIASRDQLNGSTSNVRATFFATARSYYELNPYRANTGSAIFAAGVPATPVSNDKIYYRNVVGSLKIVNMTTLATHAKVFWVMCKKDTTVGPITTWSDAILDENMGTTVAVPVTVTTATSATPGGSLTLDVGTSPLTYQVWRDVWKVLHTESYYLQAGDQIDTNFKFNINKLITKSTIEEESTLFLANLSIVPFVIHYGALTGVSDAVSATTAAEVTIGRTKIGVFVQQNHEFGPVPAETRTPTTQHFSGITENTSTHVYDEHQIDDTDENDTIKVT